MGFDEIDKGMAGDSPAGGGLSTAALRDAREK